MKVEAHWGAQQRDLAKNVISILGTDIEIDIYFWNNSKQKKIMTKYIYVN